MSSDVKIYPRFPQSYFYTKRFVVLNYRMKINYSSDALSWHSSCRITSGVTLKSSYIHLGSEKTIYLLELIFYCAKNIAFDVFLPWFIDKSTYRAGKDGYQNIILGDYTIFLYWDIVLLYVFIMQTSLFAAKSQASFDLQLSQHSNRTILCNFWAGTYFEILSMTDFKTRNHGQNWRTIYNVKRGRLFHRPCHITYW